MCKKTEEPPPQAIHAGSSIATSDGYGDWVEGSPPSMDRAILKQEEYKVFPDERSTTLSFVASLVAGTASAAVLTGFALWFPFALAPEAASKTYDWAFYTYDAKLSHFDNTIWTYGTDYGLATVMALLTISILLYSRPNVSDGLCYRSASLLLGYSISTFAGGYCHQNYLTLEARNSMSFQLLWTVCVGSVTAASCFMGISGTEVVRRFQQQPGCSPLLQKIPLVPESFWWSFGVFVTAVCAWGGMSFQRPACDIFIAGTTQLPSTIYLMTFMGAVQHPKVKLWARVIGVTGFILNAPLLPIYPLLIQYTDWSLASVNTLLHSVLCLAWSMQGLSLRHMIQALVAAEDELVASKRR